MISSFVKLFLNTILLLLSPLFLLLLLPIYAFRLFVAKVVIHCYPRIDKILTTRSSCSGAEPLYTSPKCSLVICGIAEGRIDTDQFQILWKSRLLEAKDADGKLTKPEFQQYVTKRLGFLFWKWEENFDISKHVREYDGKLKLQFRNGTLPISPETVTMVTDELIYKPFVPKTSPWEVLLIHDFQELDSVNGLRVGPISTVVILRIHHCLGDGFSILKTFNTNITQTKEIDTAQPKYTGLNRGSAVLRSLKFTFSAPYEFLTEAKNAMDINSWHVPKAQLTHNMNSAITPKIPIELFKEVKNFHKVTFTTLVFECFTAALRKFMMEAGFKVPEVIHCVTPLPVPGHPDKMRNHM
jgi:hypothetical protein